MPLTRADELPRVLSAATAGLSGVTRSTARTQLAHGSWQRMAPGVLLTRPDPPTRYDWAAAGVLLAPRAAVSGWEALQLAGLTRAQAPAGLPVLVLTREHRSRRLGPLLIRRTDRPYTAQVTPWQADLPLTAVVQTARAVADVAISLSSFDAVRDVVAAALQRRRCTVDELLDELDAGPRQGSAFFRDALGEVSAGARSVAEARALAGLRGSGLRGFELNVPVLDAGRRHVFTVDFLWRALRAALEIDSAEYHFRRGDWVRTLDRHAALTAAGLSVLHLSPSQISADGAWVARVRRWLDARAAEVRLPSGGAQSGQLRGDPVPLVLPGLMRL